jgi:phage baseplate assembly protein W
MSRLYRKYSDLDAVFAANPVSGDLSLRVDEAAVKFAIKNLVLTRNFERPFDSSIGSQIKNYLFELIDDTSIIIMKQIIARSIQNHEPRVILLDVNIQAKEDSNEVIITIIFKIINTDKPLTISIALERTR